MSQIGNDNIHRGSKIVFGDDNIHSSSCVAGGKAKNLFLYVSSTFQCDNYNGILKCIMGCNVLILAQTNVANGYPNYPWYDHTDIMKNAQL